MNETESKVNTLIEESIKRNRRRRKFHVMVIITKLPNKVEDLVKFEKELKIFKYIFENIKYGDKGVTYKNAAKKFSISVYRAKRIYTETGPKIVFWHELYNKLWMCSCTTGLRYSKNTVIEAIDLTLSIINH